MKVGVQPPHGRPERIAQQRVASFGAFGAPSGAGREHRNRFQEAGREASHGGVDAVAEALLVKGLWQWNLLGLAAVGQNQV